MAKFMLQINFFEFNGKFKQWILDTTIGTMFIPTCACTFMNEIETKFLESQESKPLVWFWYIDNIFFSCKHRKEKHEKFLNDFKKYHPYGNSIMSFIKKVFLFWMLKPPYHPNSNSIMSLIKKAFLFWILKLLRQEVRQTSLFALYDSTSILYQTLYYFQVTLKSQQDLFMWEKERFWKRYEEYEVLVSGQRLS